MRAVFWTFTACRGIAAVLADAYCVLALAAASIVWALFDLMAHLLQAG